MGSFGDRQQQYVFYLGLGDPELLRDCVDVIAAPEAVEDVTDTSPTASEDWLTEGALGVGNDLGGRRR